MENGLKKIDRLVMETGGTRFELKEVAGRALLLVITNGSQVILSPYQVAHLHDVVERAEAEISERQSAAIAAEDARKKFGRALRRWSERAPTAFGSSV